MKTEAIIAAIIVLILLAGAVFLIFRTGAAKPAETATSTPNAVVSAQSVSMASGIAFSYTDPYGLATTKEQVTVLSYIPPCDEGFDYCLYRTGTQYANTNFESAGVGIKERKDLTTEADCLTKEPDGFSNLHATSTMSGAIGTSVMGPVGDAGAGHRASGTVYRLWTGSVCEEFATRIGETEYTNFPAGTKTEFSASDRASVTAELTKLISSVKINGSVVAFP